ncbi:SIS domain-containing protein [Methanomassiliicoccus luminyensis]|jgi:6-phospho-3-hexuloisomerase|uniref:SIS domain-containing protein n=1 Tax=Methanomassiliicoccus luminyensis TaxID=1080712 RepID=UPI0004749822|nr:SIS domain-containing protein [Methanomassiliicoccus luminyensis]
MQEPLRYILREMQEALEKMDPSALDGAIAAIVGSKKIFIYGVGRSGLVGQAFAVRLVQLGFNVHFVGDMTTPIVDAEDLVIIVSNTGETMSAVQTANIVRRVGATVISVTSNPNSKLGHASNLILEIPLVKDEQKRKYAPLGTIFEDTALVLFDSLVPIIMERTSQNEASLRRRHAIWV